MAQIIQLTTFSGYDGAKQLADLKVRRCDSVVYCKSQAEANCYRVMIEHFTGGRKGVDHLYGIIAICVDPTSTVIEGMHLISQKIPSHIKSSYPFQLQAKKIGIDRQARFLESCGLTTEKELKAVWERCANRLTFPIEATADEKENYFSMFNTADTIIQDEAMAKKKVFIDEIKTNEAAIVKWFTNKFGNNFKQVESYSWRKSWRVGHRIDGYKSYSFNVDMDFSQSKGVESFRISYSGLDHGFSFSWDQDKNMTAVLSRIEMMWDQFAAIMVAVSKAHKASTMKITVL